MSQTNLQIVLFVCCQTGLCHVTVQCNLLYFSYKNIQLQCLRFLATGDFRRKFRPQIPRHIFKRYYPQLAVLHWWRVMCS